jgi:hypothetical protein
MPGAGPGRCAGDPGARRLLKRDRSCYYDVVKKLTGASRGRFWVKTAELRHVLLG